MGWRKRSGTGHRRSSIAIVFNEVVCDVVIGVRGIIGNIIQSDNFLLTHSTNAIKYCLMLVTRYRGTFKPEGGFNTS